MRESGLIQIKRPESMVTDCGYGTREASLARWDSLLVQESQKFGFTHGYLFMALLNKGTAIVSRTAPNTARTMTSVIIASVPAPSTMTFLIALAA